MRIVCHRFAVLASSNEEPEECVVCERPIRAHRLPGVRLLSAAEIRIERSRAINPEPCSITRRIQIDALSHRVPNRASAPRDGEKEPPLSHTHRLRDNLHITLGHFDQPSPKRHAPMLLRTNERQLL